MDKILAKTTAVVVFFVVSVRFVRKSIELPDDSNNNGVQSPLVERGTLRVAARLFEAWASYALWARPRRKLSLLVVTFLKEVHQPLWRTARLPDSPSLLKPQQQEPKANKWHKRLGLFPHTPSPILFAYSKWHFRNGISEMAFQKWRINHKFSISLHNYFIMVLQVMENVWVEIHCTKIFQLITAAIVEK